MARSVKVFLVRHAKAGDRSKWTDPDEIRPLTKAGRRQADGLIEQLAGFEIRRIVSSRYVRCVQTVEPLAAKLGLHVELDEALAEGADLHDTLGLIERLDMPTALCTHGDVLEYVIGHLQRRHVPRADRTLGKKGSTWVLDVDGGEIKAAVYLEPPA